MKYFFATSLLLFLVVGCSKREKTIEIGYETLIGHETVVIAEKMKFFAKEGIKVRLNYFNSLSDLVRAFEEEKIDVMFSTTNEVLQLASKGENPRIILLVDYSNGANAIVAKADIKDVRDLQGKKISLETKTVSHFLLLQALKKYNVNPDSLSLINVEGTESIRLFKNNEISAVATWSPYISKLQQYNGHIIFSSKDLPGEIVDVMSVRQDLIENHPDICQGLVSGYLKTQDWAKNNYNEALNIIDNNYRLSKEPYKENIKRVQLGDMNNNLTAFGTPQSRGTLYHSINEFMLFLVEQEQIPKKLNTEVLINPTFVWHYAKSNK